MRKIVWVALGIGLLASFSIAAAEGQNARDNRTFSLQDMTYVVSLAKELRLMDGFDLDLGISASTKLLDVPSIVELLGFLRALTTIFEGVGHLSEISAGLSCIIAI